ADRRRVRRRTLDQAGKQRCFGHIQICGRLSEETKRGGLGAVQAVTEINLVQIELEDLFLGELPLEASRDDHLLDLAPHRLVRRQEALTRELLCKRAASLCPASLTKIVERRASNANQVDATVIVETLILDGHDRLDEIGRDARERHIDALLTKNR